MKLKLAGILIYSAVVLVLTAAFFVALCVVFHRERMRDLKAHARKTAEGKP